MFPNGSNYNHIAMRDLKLAHRLNKGCFNNAICTYWFCCVGSENYYKFESTDVRIGSHNWNESVINTYPIYIP